VTTRPASTSPHILLSCGEASGDRYGAALLTALRRRLPDARFSALGGDALRAAGAEIVQPSDRLSVMGLGEVLGALPALLAARRRLRSLLSDGGVDLFLPVDYPGFNLGMARHARGVGVPVFYLIAPQLWAWGAWRAGGVRRAVDRLGVVLPFEEAYFQARGIPAVSLGHPLVEDHPKPEVDRALRRREERRRDPAAPLTVGLLPGSRAQEVRALLPVLREAFVRLRDATPGRVLRGVVSRAPGAPVPDDPGEGLRVSAEPLATLTRDLDLALVCSGTASLEVALAGVPHALVYRTSPSTYALARRLVRLEWIGLANLVLERPRERPLVREFVQDAARPEALAADLRDWLDSGARRARFASGVDELRERLGGAGFWDRAADEAVSLWRERTGSGR
jgi:lipid-A-disaccharide synthase